MNEEVKDVVIVKTDEGHKNGQTKCPKCGATDISLNVKAGKLRCNFCRCEFENELVDDANDDIHNLTNEVIASGAKNIIVDSKDLITLKCTSCGAEVVIDTASSATARCHWCRNSLSINEQLPNGAIPDMILPFKITKEEAKTEIEKFVLKRKFFAHPKFSKEFTTNNIMGVYLPYMVVDVNGHSKMSGKGEKLVRRYTVKRGDHSETRYDADLYNIEREFDILIDDLTIESSSDKLNNSNKLKTNNIINSILPFDTKNCVSFDANFMRGYTSEKRDTNIDELRNITDLQVKDIARHKANELIDEYDRGVCWEEENMTVKGQKWKSSYLPIWLYSYLEVKNNNKVLHYVAVNARTKETMGSVPINMLKLMIISILIEILGFIGFVKIDSDYSFVFLLTGILYFSYIYSRYRNQGARHNHESETLATIENAKKQDKYLSRRTGLSNSTMSGANNHSVNGSTNNLNIPDLLNGTTLKDKYVKKVMKEKNITGEEIKKND